jgi:hypothetical protein
VDALAHPDHYRKLREAGRRTIIERFDLRRVCLPAWLVLLDRSIGAGGLPVPASGTG